MYNKYMREVDAKRGMSLVEVVIGATIVLVGFLSLVGVYNVYLRNGFQNINKVQAALLAEEGIEALRLIRSTSWTGQIAPLSVGSPYYFLWNGSGWVSSTSNIFIDGIYERKFVVSSVSRDASGKIVTSGGANDSGTKKMTVTVSWRTPKGATTSLSIATYLTNIFSN